MEEVNYDKPFGLTKLDSDLLRSFNSTLKELRGLVISNIEFFQRGRSSLHARFYASSCILLERTQILEPLVLEIVPHLHKFDFSEDVPGNGYRSFISLLYRCSLYLVQLCRHIHTSRSSLFFQSSRYCKDLESYVETLGQLLACLTYLKQLMAHCSSGDLFMTDNSVVGDSLLLQLEMVNIDCFYGRCLGFQFCETMQKALQAVIVVMATFSECYDEPSQVMQLASSVLNSGKYVFDQELRARQVVNITRTGDIKFCKAFWSIPESPIFTHLRSFTFAHVEVSDVISLDPVNFELPSTCSEETVTITPPCAHIGPAPVKVRLISHVVREGQDMTRSRFRPKTGSAKPTVLPKSPNLLFHCHGGGFVAQSSQSHENYLRMWARELEVPILSVDYSLAPDYPFPRALEESFYAYAWALKNPDKLGWTGERVCFAGDSAGANLVVSTALRAVSFEIRVPDGIVSMYAPFLIQYSPSSARFMSMIDPLLPVGILMRCLAAYAGIADEFSSALAKPIFCNPGTVEPWEIVDSEEMQHMDNYIGEIKPHTADCVQLSLDTAEEMNGEIENGVLSKTSSNCTENISNDVDNQNTNTDGAQDIQGSTHDQGHNGSLCECTCRCSECKCRCSVKNGCEMKSKAQNVKICDDNGATYGSSNTLPMDKEDVETKFNNEDTKNTKMEASTCRMNNNADKEDETGYTLGDIVFVDSEMIPGDMENANSHLNTLSSSKILDFVRKDNPVKSLVSGVENPVKSLVSGVKSFMSRHKKAKLATPEIESDAVSTINNVEETREKYMESEQFESDVDNGSPSKVKDNKMQVSYENHINTSLEMDKSKDVLEDNEENEADHTQHVNKTDSNNRSEADLIAKDKNQLNQTEDPNLQSELINGLLDEEKQTDTDTHGESETNQKNSNVASTNLRQGDEPEIKVSDCCDRNKTVNETNQKTMETKTNVGANDLEFEQTNQYAKAIVDKLVNTSPKLDRTRVDLDNKENDDDGDDVVDDEDDGDPEDMENFIESISQHVEDTEMNSVVSETSSNSLKEAKEGRKETVDCVTTETASVNSKTCDAFEGSKLCNNENFDNKNEAKSDDINTVEERKETNSPDASEMYAICQELLDEASISKHEIGACGYNDAIISSSSCHTIEDRSSYYCDGYDRKLSIHSEGSCDSIEDSDAWMTGQDIDIEEVESNDIVTVINDCDQNYLCDDLSENNQGDLNESRFYIDTSDQSCSNPPLSDNKWQIKTSTGLVSKGPQSSADVLSDSKYEMNLENTNSVSAEHAISAGETSEHLHPNQADSNCSSANNSDVSSSKDTEKCDKARAESDPTDHTSGVENNNDATIQDVRKQSRRTMSLDLTNDLTSFTNNTDILSPMKSMTMPRSSTVPELLSGAVAPKLFSVQRNIVQSPIQLFRKLPIVKNPYMSPILAPDDMIQGLPMVYLIACHFDPLLDDSVMFARKLRDLGKDVNLHIVDHLPHGFLNFSDASPEAKQASKYCLHRIMDVLKIEHKT